MADETQEKDPPRLFGSYSHTSPGHKQWVLDLATDLREAGVDVIIDEWDLGVGEDAHQFMERMVTDKSIKKVILICDEEYVKKANAREGGAGTEAQIISAELYRSEEAGKFAAIIKERDKQGEPHKPTFYQSKIYIDFSDASITTESFDELLRWAHDKPVNKRPAIGKIPRYLSDEESEFALATSSRQRAAVDAMRKSKPNANGALSEYLDLFSSELENIRIDLDSAPDKPFDEKVTENIEGFLPYRNEIVAVFHTIAQYHDTPETRESLHRFFESLIPYLTDTTDNFNKNNDSVDNYKFIIHELFIYAIATLLQHNRFKFAANLTPSITIVTQEGIRHHQWFLTFNSGSTYVP